MQANLLIDPSCEEVSAWSAFDGNLTLSTVARTGSSACSVCPDPGKPISSLDDLMDNVVPQIGDRYQASAWIRAASESTGSGEIVIAIRQWRELYDVSTTLSSVGAPITPSRDEWQQIMVSHAVQAPAGVVLDVFVQQIDPNEPCFLIDDIPHPPGQLTPPVASIEATGRVSLVDDEAIALRL